MLNKAAVSLSIGLILLFLSCGTEPPPPLWSGTPEDSTAVEALISKNQTLFTVNNFNQAKDSLKLHTTLYTSYGAVPVTEWTFGLDSIAVRYIPDFLGFKITNEKHSKKFFFTRDTTITVVLIDSFEVEMEYDVGRICSLFYFKDTLPDTSTKKPLLDTVVVNNVTGLTHKKQFKRGEARTYLFFDSAGTGAWKFVKYTPTIINFPMAESVPSSPFVKFFLTGSTRIDTFYYQTTDNKKQAMNILRPPDSVLTFKTGDSLNIAFKTYYSNAEHGFYIFYGHYQDKHKQLSEVHTSPTDTAYSGYFHIKLDSPGDKRVYLQLLNTSSFYFPNTQKAKRDFYSTIWAIPIKVK